MIAYNALRLLMLKSAKIHGCNHRRLSFKGALQVQASTASTFADALANPRRSAGNELICWNESPSGSCPRGPAAMSLETSNAGQNALGGCRLREENIPTITKPIQHHGKFLMKPLNQVPFLLVHRRLRDGVEVHSRP